MDLGIKGKVALVTAASKGLGRASALELSREGCRLAICSRTQEDIERVAQEIGQETGNEVVPFVADMASEADIDRLMNDVRGRMGDPDIVVVNAGGPPPGTFATTPVENYPKAVELTLMSGVRMTHAALPAMQKKGWGRIVYISSVSVKQPIPTILLSNMARAGLTGFVKTVANEVAASGVTLNQVLPGAHKTDRIRENAAEQARNQGITVEEALERGAQSIPMKRMGEPQEIAALVAFLASQRAAFMTGCSIQHDGGAYLGLL